MSVISNRRNLVGIIILGLLGWGAFRLTGEFGSFYEVHPCDEDVYVNAASGQLRSNLSWGPLYLWWYQLLFWLGLERIELYQLNFRVLIALPGLLVATMLVVLRGSWTVGVLLGWLVISSSGNILVCPKVGNAAAVLSLMTVFAGVGAKDRARWLLTAVSGLFLASLLRPEFLLSLMLLSPIALWDFLRAKDSRKVLAGGVLVVLLAWIIVLLVSSFAQSKEFSRSWEAFCQHFSLNWVAWHSDPRSAWYECEAIVHEAFGSVTSIGQAARSNPSLFLSHVAYNLKSMPGVVYGSFFTFPERPLVTAVMPYFLMGAGGLGLFRLCQMRKNLVFMKQIWPTLYLLTAMALPGFIASIIFYPREHYLYLPIICLLVGLVPVLFRSPGWSGTAADRYGALALSILFLILADPLGQHCGGRVESGSIECAPRVALIRALMGREDRLMVIGGERILRVYLQDRAEFQPPGNNREQFDLQLLDPRVALVDLDGFKGSVDTSIWQRWEESLTAPGPVFCVVRDLRGARVLVNKSLFREVCDKGGK